MALRRDRYARALAGSLLLTLALAGCLDDEKAGAPAFGADKTLDVASPAFPDGGAIPPRFTCDAADDGRTSPALRIREVPAGTQAFALIMDDPDASRTWIHWTFWDLPLGHIDLQEGANVTALGATEGQGSGEAAPVGYRGPCPPSGVHHYRFKVYALSEKLGPPRGAPLSDLEDALRGNVLAWGELVGTYPGG